MILRPIRRISVFFFFFFCFFFWFPPFERLCLLVIRRAVGVCLRIVPL